MATSMTGVGRADGARVEKDRVGPRNEARARRNGCWLHPYGGMRKFAEDRAKHSDWDRLCLEHMDVDVRKRERGKLSDSLSEQYKIEFIRINVASGKGRPKANNISAAKKTVKMIAERVLLSLEARATQVMFKEVLDIREQTEKELMRLRQIDECGTENPKLTYDEIRAIAREKLSARESAVNGGAGAIVGGGAVPVDGTVVVAPARGAAAEPDEKAVEIEMMKQAIVEMRAEEVAKGFTPALLNEQWVEKITAACKKLLTESYAKQYVPRTRVMGCKHFTRKNRILMACCGTFPVCRMCHFQDPDRIHDIKIEPVTTMLCMICGEVQPKTKYCRKCGVCFGQYYCHICGITDDTPDYDLRHCDKCNVCMPGLTFHCDLCKRCVPYTHDHYATIHGVMMPTGVQSDGPPPPPTTHTMAVHQNIHSIPFGSTSTTSPSMPTVDGQSSRRSYTTFPTL